MPTYDFKCKRCGLEFELNRPIEQRNDLYLCPSCDEYTIERVISFNGLTWAPTAGGMR